MTVLIIDNGTSLLQHLDAAIKGPRTLVRFDDLSLVDQTNFSSIILSGSSQNPISSISQFLTEIDLLKNTRKPVLGICFGFELIVKGFGGTLKNLKEEHHGMSRIMVVEDDPIFSGLKSFDAYEHHEITLDRLPPHFKVLARSGGEVSVIRHETLPIYGFQFHPEYDPRDSGVILLRNFLDMKS